MVATRSKTRALTGPSSDTEMDEGPQTFALTQPLDLDLLDIPSNLQLLPTDHFEHVVPTSNRQPTGLSKVTAWPHDRMTAVTAPQRSWSRSIYINDRIFAVNAVSCGHFIDRSTEIMTRSAVLKRPKIADTNYNGCAISKLAYCTRAALCESYRCSTRTRMKLLRQNNEIFWRWWTKKFAQSL